MSISASTGRPVSQLQCFNQYEKPSYLHFQNDSKSSNLKTRMNEISIKINWPSDR